MFLIITLILMVAVAIILDSVGIGKSVIRGMVAVLLSAPIFAFIHVSFTNFTVTDVLANLPILALGSTTAALYWKTDNIICPILLHVAINSIGTFG